MILKTESRGLKNSSSAEKNIRKNLLDSVLTATDAETQSRNGIKLIILFDQFDSRN